MRALAPNTSGGKCLGEHDQQPVIGWLRSTRSAVETPIRRWSRSLLASGNHRLGGLAGGLYRDVLLGGGRGCLFGECHIHGQDALVVAGFESSSLAPAGKVTDLVNEP